MEKTIAIKKTSGEEGLSADSQTIIHENNLPVKDYDIDGFLQKRKEFIQKVNNIMVKGSDYHEIQGRKSLAKGGAEKIASVFGWQSEFVADEDTLKMFGGIAGLVAYKCTLTKNLEFIGQGRGSASLSKNSSDPNKTIKMAQKSAFIDAVLRSSGLSDFFTQDIGPEDEGASYGHAQSNQPTYGTGTTTPINTPYKAPEAGSKVSEKQLDLIKSICQQKGYTKDDIYDAGFKTLTGGKGGTASELIDWLLKAPVKDFLTEMDQERELKEIGDSIQ